MRQYIYRYVFHFICYYIAWFASILFASIGDAWKGPQIVLLLMCIQTFFLYQKTSVLIIPFTIILTAFGLLVDSIFIYTGNMILHANPFQPLSSPWMIGIWVVFSIVLFDTCYRYFKHFFILSLLSFFGFALAYYLGVKLGAAFLPHGLISLFYLSLVYAVILPAVCYVFYKVGGQNDVTPC